MKSMNIYLLIVLANVLLTFGNALQGRKLGHLNPATITMFVFGVKFLVAAVIYGLQSATPLRTIVWWEWTFMIVVGISVGLGEYFLFCGLARNTYLVSAMGCLYSIFLAFFAFTLTGEAPKPMMIGAILLSGAAIYMAHLATVSD